MTWEEMIQKRRQKESTAQCLSDLNIPENIYLNVFGLEVLRLNALESSAVLLRFVEALPIARVADRMGMSWEGADSLIDRATSKLKSFLKNYYKSERTLEGISHEMHYS